MGHAYIVSVGCAFLGALLILIQSMRHWSVLALRVLAWALLSIIAWHIFSMSIMWALLIFSMGSCAVFLNYPVMNGCAAGLLLVAPLAIYFHQSWHFVSVLYSVMSLLLMGVASVLYTLNAIVLRRRHELVLPMSISQLHQGRFVIEWLGVILFALSIMTGYLISHSWLAIGVLCFMLAGGYYFRDMRSFFLLILMLIVWGFHEHF